MDYVSGWVLCHHVWTMQQLENRSNDDYIAQYTPSRVMQGARRLGRFVRRHR